MSRLSGKMNGGRAGTAGHTVWEWVRGIVSSDDTLLVATSAGPAYVMTVLSVFSWQWLTLSTASCPTPRLEKVELFLRRYDLCSFFGGLSAAPPPTGWRKRKDLDVYDQLMYMRNRRSRFFNYFFSVARDDMTYWVNRSVPWFLAFRLMLIWCPLDLAMIFRSLLSPFLGSTIAAQQQWFGASVSSMVLGDATVGALGLGSGAFVYTVLGLLPFSDALDTLLFYGILGFLISVAGLLGFLFVITSQQRKYYKDFEPSEVVGPCPDHDKCPCLSVAFFQKD
ncbi:unnamed protein product [Effrenium voratum]|uniref:Uncharacterized protein n=1 Tax=Effrenium voratum TaxID=2562239 RepID=A0AA36JB40_9DINO|nr:unnamed protein product [Effrenium voratum]